MSATFMLELHVIVMNTVTLCSVLFSFGGLLVCFFVFVLFLQVIGSKPGE